MIDVKQAVAVAYDFFRSLYSNDSHVSNTHLEEVEISDDGKYWLITLSYFHEQTPPLSTLRQPLSTLNSPWQNPPRQNKEYKIFRINAETGEPQAMKIREV